MDQKTIKLETIWNGDLKGKGHIKADYLDTDIAIPQAMGGSGEGTEPQELLISAATTCFKMTLVGALAGRKLPLDCIEMNVEAVNSNEDGMNITYYPTVTLAGEMTEKQIESAERAIESTNKTCEVGNILKNAGAEINVKGIVKTN